VTIVKSSLDMIERVYSTATLGTPPTALLAASEGYGPCKLYSTPSLDGVVIDGNPGGTTDLCPHPSDNDVFFAVTGFVPVFDAAQSHFNVVRRDGDEWSMTAIEKIPYLHRFDVLEKGGRLYLVGASLCERKDARDDWSSAGEVFVREIDPKTFALGERRNILGDLYVNHGFTRTVFRGREVYLISSRSGLHEIEIPDDPLGDWNTRQLLDEPMSDSAVCDIDGDGIDELATISPFHGDSFRILKPNGTAFEEMYSKKIEFGHVLWGGETNGVPSFFLGYRKAEMALVLIRFVDGRFVETAVDAGGGPSQITVFQNPCSCSVLVANRATGVVDGEVAVYTIFEDAQVMG